MLELREYVEISGLTSLNDEQYELCETYDVVVSEDGSTTVEFYDKDVVFVTERHFNSYDIAVAFIEEEFDNRPEKELDVA